MAYILLLLLLVVLFLELYPVKVLKVESCPKKGRKNSKETPTRDFAVHLHTMFSYDSLGKPEEVEREAKFLGLEKIFITDHDREDLDKYLPPSEVLVAGYEYQDGEYGRLLKLQMGKYTVIAHPNNEKKELYRWRGKYERDFYYELIDLKDVLYAAPWWLKLYFSLRSAILLPLRGFKALDYFPKLIPLHRWVEIYLTRTGGSLPVIGGLDHHVKLTLWEKPKKYLSFPRYGWSFYLLRNRAFVDIDTALRSGKFYISLCGGRIEIEKKRLLLGERELLFLHYGGGKVEVNDCGRVDKNAPVAVVYKYLFRLGNVYFSLTPLAVFKTDLIHSEESL